mgnify:CR=1 FL=1
MRILSILTFYFILSVSDIKVLLADEVPSKDKLINKIYNFSSKEIDNNMQTKWSLTGLFLEKYENNYTYIKNPKLNIYDSNLITKISSDTAIDRTGKMDEIYLNNNVFINRNSISNESIAKLYTSYAIFYLTKNLVETDRDVTIITADSTTTGNGLSANLDSGLITILSDVERVVKKDNGFQTIKGNQMVYNTKTDEWVVKNQPASKLKKAIKEKVKSTFSLE